MEVSALVFDGLMVYKDTVKDINELLEGCSESVKEALNCDIVVTLKGMDEGYEDLPTESNLNAKNLELLRKGIYPYEYMDSFERFNETQLPSIAQKDYEHAQKVWKEFNCKTLGDYHDLYLSLMSLYLLMYSKLSEKHV